MNNNQLEQQLLLATQRVPQNQLDDAARPLHQAYCCFADLLDTLSEEVDTESLVDKVLAAAPNRTAPRQDFLLSLLATAAAFLLLIPLASTQWETGREVAHSVKTPLAESETPSIPEPPVDEVALDWNDDWDVRMEQAEDLAAAVRWSSLTRFEAVEWSVSEERRIVDSEWHSGSM